MTDRKQPQGEHPEDDRTHLVGAETSWSESGPAQFAHYLVVVEGLQPGRRIAIKDEPVTIGRIPPCEVVLPDTELSRAHCRLETVEGEVIVTDLNSTNGTFVDGKRITGAVKFASGATLRVGRQIMRHELRTRHEAAATEEM